MQSKKHKKRLARALAAAITAVTVLALVPVTALARPSGNTVLLEDYYGLCDGNAAQVPGLRYTCSGHGDKMIEYYVEVEDDGRYTALCADLLLPHLLQHMESRRPMER